VKPIVAIVGRPNVGKSTLFNRIIQQRLAIVESEPGITRDRIYADSEWNGRRFTLVDTGGIELGDGDAMAVRVRRQAELAIEGANVIVFVVDGRQGLTVTDREVADILRRTEKPVILAVNKMENWELSAHSYEFYSLSIGDPVPISAAHGTNTGDLLDRIVELFPPETSETEEDKAVRVAVIGRPNVGKSSLINAIMGEERVIVSEIPGTTRDAIDIIVDKDGKKFNFIDTAGLRRRSRIGGASVERYSVLRTLRAIDRSDVVLMLIDAVEGVAEQDKKIAGYAHEAGKAAIVVVNKWDLIDKDNKTTERYKAEIRRELAFLHYAPLVFISAKTGQRVGRLYDMIESVANQYFLRLATAVINTVVRDAVDVNPPPTDKGKRLKLYYVTQPSIKPPTFVFFVNEPELMHFSYKRYLENKLREAFGFEGTPLRLVVKQRE